jgi:DNA-binding CsgD family transcriptional regulator
LSVVASNEEGVRILTFPERPENIRNIDTWVANKIRSTIIARQTSPRSAGEFQSAKRTYVWRSFSLFLSARRKSPALDHCSNQSAGFVMLMFERKSNEAVMIAEISERFGLTAREVETVQFLLEGFTSKEIAQRMQISPNTVKAFIRLVMVKMNVSTRSGIIGKIVGTRTNCESGAGQKISQG